MTILKTGRVSRRTFVATSAAAAAILPLGAARARSAAKYTRPNVTGPRGQEMLKSMAVGIQAMLALPASDPRNWFRNAFVHALDCPHGNYYFAVWHRAYLGFTERALRAMSGNPDFVLPYWDWTQSPQLPDQMFDGVLSPTNAAYEPYLSNVDTLRKFIDPALRAFWAQRTPIQIVQTEARGLHSLDEFWNHVKADPKLTSRADARYLSRGNPQPDGKTAAGCSAETIASALAATGFTEFSGAKVAGHNEIPAGGNGFSMIEGLPHNTIHNAVAGVGRVARSHWGLMADCLSPIDPLFFLLHANVDRLWDVWTRKQEARGLPSLPTGDDRERWQNEEFPFFVNAKGNPVESSTAGRYAATGAFDHDYEPGWGEDLVGAASGGSGITPAFSFGGGTSGGGSHGVDGHPTKSHSGGGVGIAIPLTSLFGSGDKDAKTAAAPRFEGKTDGSSATIEIPAETLEQLASGKSGRYLVATITLPYPVRADAPRTFDVLVNAPASLASAGAEHPSYTGTFAFFSCMGPMTSGMQMDATFHVPLGRALQALAANNMLGSGPLTVRVVPQGGGAARMEALSAEVW